MNLKLLSILSFLLVFSHVCTAVVLSYYRFEVDLDADPLLLETPNEIGGESALTSASAGIDDSANPGSLPNLFVPGTGAANTASLDGLSTGSGNPDINASAAYTSTLDVAEMTVELFVRTEEQDAVIISRSGTADVGTSIDDGFRIYNPDNLTVDFYTWDGSGNVQLHQIVTTAGLDDLTPTRGDGVAAWRHLAFTYEQSTGLGLLYLDGVVIGTASSTAGASLYWGNSPAVTQPILQVGVNMDGFDFSKTADDNGYIDEIRISSGALPPEDLLNVPEPSAYALFMGLASLFLVGRRKKRAFPDPPGKTL